MNRACFSKHSIMHETPFLKIVTSHFCKNFHDIKARKCIFLILTFSLLINKSASCQQAWTLEQCISHAYENNIQIKMKELNVEYNQNNYRQSLIGVLPNIYGNVFYGISQGRVLDQTTYQFTNNQTINSSNLSLGASIVLFNGFQRNNTVLQNQYNVLASREDVAKFKNDMGLNIALGYLQILLNQELVNTSKEQLAITNLQLERTKQLVEAGSLPQGSLYEVQSQSASEELTLVTRQNQFDISTLSLKQMLELDTVKNFSILVPDFTNLSIEAVSSYADDIYKEAERNLPQIRLAEYQLKGIEKGLSIARGGRSPKVVLSASYGSGYSDARTRFGSDTARILTTPIGFLANNPSELVVYKHPTTYSISYPFSSQLRDNANTAVSLSVSIPIFNGWMINNNISNAKINVLNSKYQLDYTKKQLYKDIQQALTDAIASYRQYVASDKAVASIQESFRNIQQKYDVGMVNFVDYSTSKNQLTLAQSQMLQAKYSYIFKTKVLEFYKGGQIKF